MQGHLLRKVRVPLLGSRVPKSAPAVRWPGRRQRARRRRLEPNGPALGAKRGVGGAFEVQGNPFLVPLMKPSGVYRAIGTLN